MAALLAGIPVADAQISTRIDQYMHDPAIINPAAMNSYSRARLISSITACTVASMEVPRICCSA